MNEYDLYEKDWYLVSKLTNKKYKILVQLPVRLVVRDLLNDKLLSINISKVGEYYKYKRVILTDILKEL